MISEVSRILVSSPGDVVQERMAVKETILQKNSALIHGGKVLLWPLMWEDMVGGYGLDPQEVINEQIREFEVFIGVLWSRFGTASQRFGSGTEEEFELAVKLAEAKGIPIYVFYKSADLPTDVDVDQLDKVRKFVSRISKRVFLKKFISTEDLRREVDVSLTSYIFTTAKSHSSYVDAAYDVVSEFIIRVKSEQIVGDSLSGLIVEMDSNLNDLYASSALKFVKGTQIDLGVIEEREERAQAVLILLNGFVNALEKLPRSDRPRQEAGSGLKDIIRKFSDIAPLLARI